MASLKAMKSFDGIPLVPLQAPSYAASRTAAVVARAEESNPELAAGPSKLEGVSRYGVL